MPAESNEELAGGRDTAAHGADEVRDPQAEREGPLAGTNADPPTRPIQPPAEEVAPVTALDLAAPAQIAAEPPAETDERAAPISGVEVLPAAPVSSDVPDIPATAELASGVAPTPTAVPPEDTAAGRAIEAAPAPAPSPAPGGSAADQAIAAPTRPAVASARNSRATAERAAPAGTETSVRAARVAARFSPRTVGPASELTASVSATEGADAPAQPTSAASSGVPPGETARPRAPGKRARRAEARAARQAGRPERDDLVWARLGAEIDRLIGRALEGAGEAADGDGSLRALSAAAEMLAAAPVESGSPERHRDLAQRLWRAHVDLGHARRERGDLDGALAPLSSAVDRAAGDAERDREAREALAGAIDALVERLADDTLARMRADDVGGAMATSRRLSQVVDDALARGLSPSDLAGALARRQAVMLALAEGRPV